MSGLPTTFDYFLQGTNTTGYYKKVNGQDVVLFVAQENRGTVKAGQVIGGWVPSQKNPHIMNIVNQPHVQSYMMGNGRVLMDLIYWKS